jgi:hypothetical protein
VGEEFADTLAMEVDCSRKYSLGNSTHTVRSTSN